MSEGTKPSPAALAAADAICQRHGMLPGGYMRDSLAADLDLFALERGRDASSATVTMFVEAVKAIAPLTPNLWSQTWPPGPVLERLLEPYKKLLTAAAHALRSYEFGNASRDLAKEIADQIDALRPAGTMLGQPITEAERQRISKDWP